MNLADLPRGQTAIIREIQGGGDCFVRLMEMGLTPGTSVTLTGVAPFGDPIKLTIRGYQLSVRKREAAKVLVELPGTSAAIA